MTELESYAKAIAKKLKPAMEKAEEPKAQRDIFGTVRAVGSGENISYEVMLDGSDSYTPCTPTVEVHAGDRVVCHIVNHRLIVFSNLSVPSVNDQGYQHVKDIATEANELLDGVSSAAAAADKTVAEILSDAATANGIVSSMKNAADQAGTTLAQIVADADSAASTLAEMQEAAEEADTTLFAIYQDAADAATSAAEAKQDAKLANTYSTAALGQLGVMQDVIGVLSWASEHGRFTHTLDASVKDGKVYFTYDSTTGDYTPVVDPKASELSTYYELSVNEAMNDFIMAHLAVTSRGLWVLPNGANTGSVTPDTGEELADARARLGSKYKVLLASDGMYVYDGEGVLVATYGENISFSSTRPQYIGSSDAFISFTPATATEAAYITIGGSNVIVDPNAKIPLMQIAHYAEIGVLEYDCSYEERDYLPTEDAEVVEGTVYYELSEGSYVEVTPVGDEDPSDEGWYVYEPHYVLTGHVYKSKEDVSDMFDDDMYEWWLRTEAGDEFLGTGRTWVVTESVLGYRASIIGGVDEILEATLIDSATIPVTDSDGEQIMTHAIWEV